MDPILPDGPQLLGRFFREHTSVVAWFSTRPGGDGSVTPRISTALTGDPADYPQVRLTRVGGSPVQPWEARPRIQVECWGGSSEDASDLARLLVAVCGDLPGTVYPEGVAVSFDLALDLLWSPGPGEGGPGRPRYLFDLSVIFLAPVVPLTTL